MAYKHAKSEAKGLVRATNKLQELSFLCYVRSCIVIDS